MIDYTFNLVKLLINWFTKGLSMVALHKGRRNWIEVLI